MFGRDKSKHASDDVTVPMQDVSPAPVPDATQTMTLPAPQQDQPADSGQGMSVPVTVNSPAPAPETSMPAVEETPAALPDPGMSFESVPGEPVLPESPAEAAPEVSVMDAPQPYEEPALVETPAPESLADSDTSMADETPEPATESVMDEAASVSQEMLTSTSQSSTDLGTLKQNALRELSPLIDHLDQSPEKKYETAMMIFEETQEQSALNALFEAAKGLTDDKAKAEALHDVITKINSFN